MIETYRSDHAADPELYERLMRERYGPPAKVFAERGTSRRPPTFARSCLMPRLDPDPNAAAHLAELQQDLAESARRPRPIVAPKERTPPVPGAVWCDSCSSWCTPAGMCRCNDR
ncbi:hypothetical protein [Streptomyces sp. NPDC001070]